MIERLGFSEDELLSHAFAMQEVWDVSDVDKPSAMASVRRLTQVAASSDECGDDGMYCATPNIQVPSAEEPERERNRRRAVVEVVIEAKLRAAEVAREAAEKLRLLVRHCDVFRLESITTSRSRWNRAGVNQV
ncbi:hypothetical protein AaE_003299 [Aphanomyces astaci]|uniref:Uncharacterized protein n=1 Tax=Aphanomyces astaci TaxID=112090 RepID=A0A6A5ADH9_APHAT|nr:hypothetical protein AaE_003299 [Aphanomyces astaci]